MLGLVHLPLTAGELYGARLDSSVRCASENGQGVVSYMLWLLGLLLSGESMD